MMKADNKKQNNEHELLIKLLQDKYEGAKAESLTAIYAENPDYAGRIKAMGRKSKELFGTTLALYLKQIGVIGLRKKTEKASDAESGAPKEIISVQDNRVANVSEAETTVQDETESRIEAIIETEIENEIITESETSVEAGITTESEVEIEAQIKSEDDIEIKSEVDTEIKSDADITVNSENEIAAYNEPELRTELEIGSEIKTESDALLATEIASVSETAAEPETKPEPVVNPEDKVELETKKFDEVTKSVEKIVPKGEEELKKVEPEDERKAEEEFRRRAEEEKKAEEQRKLEEERRLEEERKAEELRLEEERKAEEARRAEEERIAEAQRKIEEAYKRFETEHLIWEEHCVKCLEEREEVFQKRCSDRRTELEDEAANRRDDSIKAATEIMIMYQKQLIEAQNILDSLGIFKFGEKKAQKAIIAKAEEKIAKAKHDIDAAKELYYSELPVIDFKIRLAEEQIRLDVENDIPMPIEPVLKLDTDEELSA
ncbi:MAG: hypothetical protein J5522_07115 [Lachnospiraceae bacterium]|nr:hypothetical protein [Lachnospiraceae bacterium]